MRGLVISAPSSGQGKTLVTLGLLRALRDRGIAVASAKSGPDFIDPAFHESATGRACVTLDAFAAPPSQLAARAAMQSGAEMLVVEGAMGLCDGAASGGPVGRGATVEVARALSLPVILVIDCARMGQTVGAIADGLSRAAGVPVAGVILNRVASPRHERMLREAMAGVAPVLGVLPPDPDCALPSRHLGLVQAGEHPNLEEFISRMAVRIAKTCDLDAILTGAAPLAHGPTPSRFQPLGQRIAVARDDAFSFLYWHMLEDWRAAGAEISFFSPLADQPPEDTADAVYLPGGYPELHAARVARAEGFAAGIARAATRNAIIYGECGGYMVLGQGLMDEFGTSHPMLGLLQLETSFAKKKRHLGYRHLDGETPFGRTFLAHEFHYASTLSARGEPLFRAWDGSGQALPAMGLRQGRIMGSFAHLIEPAKPDIWQGPKGAATGS